MLPPATGKPLSRVSASDWCGRWLFRCFVGTKDANLCPHHYVLIDGAFVGAEILVGSKFILAE